MNAPQYKEGGAEWEKVKTVMKECTCSRLRAVSALKVCGNDTTAAIASIQSLIETQAPSAPLTFKNVSNDSGTISTGNSANIFTVSEQPRLEEHGQILETEPATEREGSFMRMSGGVLSGGYHIPEVIENFLSEDGAASISTTLKAEVDPIQNYGTAQKKASQLSLRTRGDISPQSSGRVSPEMSKTWDFVLPVIHQDALEPGFNSDEGMRGKFSLRRLISGLQSDTQRGNVHRYLAYFNERLISENLNGTWKGFPVMFYVVATNDEAIVRKFIVDYKAPVNVIDSRYRIPLLAFSILMSIPLQKDSTSVTTTLLGLGADVSVVPLVFYSPYIDDPPNKGPFTNQRYKEFDDPSKRWCSEWIRPILAQAINLSQRYFLQKTFKDKRPSDRQQQVAVTYQATALLGISYFMIGQGTAAKLITQKLLSRFALPVSRPLVMVFAGPSGHGKTELAKRMGELLSLEMERIDCTEMRYESDMFGPKKPYIGHENGSPLNNFLAKLSGKRGIVFLDEFEKTGAEVHNAFLIPFDEGKYVDRRNRTPVDCSKIIWIIATNALDDSILDFCELHRDEVDRMDGDTRRTELMADLSDRLKPQLRSAFGNPLSGRISLVAPFLPFSPTEAAVVAHKYILELQQSARRSIELSAGSQLVGHIQLVIKQDGAVCKLIADEGYSSEQGARSLKMSVESRVTDELVRKYLEEEGMIAELQPLIKYVVDVSRRGELFVQKVH